MSLKPIRPTAKHNPMTGHAGANTYRTTCKNCGETIFTWQATRWSRDPMGLVHTECEEN